MCRPTCKYIYAGACAEFFTGEGGGSGQPIGLSVCEPARWYGASLYGAKLAKLAYNRVGLLYSACCQCHVDPISFMSTLSLFHPVFMDPHNYSDACQVRKVCILI